MALPHRFRLRSVGAAAVVVEAVAVSAASPPAALAMSLAAISLALSAASSAVVDMVKFTGRSWPFLRRRRVNCLGGRTLLGECDSCRYVVVFGVVVTARASFDFVGGLVEVNRPSVES